jgi:hypothetical protein
MLLKVMVFLADLNYKAANISKRGIDRQRRKVEKVLLRLKLNAAL